MKGYPTITRHFKILEKLQTEKDIKRIKKLCLEDIALLPDFRKETEQFGDEQARNLMELDKMIGEPVKPFSYYKEKRAQSYSIPYFPTFKQLAIIYEKEGDYENAIKICEYAIAEGFENDKTKGGMTGRLEKLRKKAGMK